MILVIYIHICHTKKFNKTEPKSELCKATKQKFKLNVHQMA